MPAFPGTVRVAGSLSATDGAVIVTEDRLSLQAGEDHLGNWSLDTLAVAHKGRAITISIDDEIVVFMTSDVDELVEAVEVGTRRAVELSAVRNQKIKHIKRPRIGRKASAKRKIQLFDAQQHSGETSAESPAAGEPGADPWLAAVTDQPLDPISSADPFAESLGEVQIEVPAPAPEPVGISEIAPSEEPVAEVGPAVEPVQTREAAPVEVPAERPSDPEQTGQRDVLVEELTALSTTPAGMELDVEGPKGSPASEPTEPEVTAPEPAVAAITEAIPDPEMSPATPKRRRRISLARVNPKAVAAIGAGAAMVTVGLLFTAAVGMATLAIAAVAVMVSIAGLLDQTIELRLPKTLSVTRLFALGLALMAASTVLTGVI